MYHLELEFRKFIIHTLVKILTCCDEVTPNLSPALTKNSGDRQVAIKDGNPNTSRDISYQRQRPYKDQTSDKANDINSGSSRRVQFIKASVSRHVHFTFIPTIINASV